MYLLPNSFEEGVPLQDSTLDDSTICLPEAVLKKIDTRINLAEITRTVPIDFKYFAHIYKIITSNLEKGITHATEIINGNNVQKLIPIMQYDEYNLYLLSEKAKIKEAAENCDKQNLKLYKLGTDARILEVMTKLKGRTPPVLKIPTNLDIRGTNLFAGNEQFISKISMVDSSGNALNDDGKKAVQFNVMNYPSLLVLSANQKEYVIEPTLASELNNKVSVVCFGPVTPVGNGKDDLEVFQKVLLTFKEKLKTVEPLFKKRTEVQDDTNKEVASIANPITLIPSEDLLAMKRLSITLATATSWTNGKINLDFLKKTKNMLNKFNFDDVDGTYKLKIQNVNEVKSYLGIVSSKYLSDTFTASVSKKTTAADDYVLETNCVFFVERPDMKLELFKILPLNSNNFILSSNFLVRYMGNEFTADLSPINSLNCIDGTPYCKIKSSELMASPLDLDCGAYIFQKRATSDGCKKIKWEYGTGYRNIQCLQNKTSIIVLPYDQNLEVYCHSSHISSLPFEGQVRHYLDTNCMLKDQNGLTILPADSSNSVMNPPKDEYGPEGFDDEDQM